MGDETLLEIREYLNEDGGIMDQEVLDVTKEYKLLAKMTEESPTNSNIEVSKNTLKILIKYYFV